jgi:fumarate hydratase class II
VAGVIKGAATAAALALGHCTEEEFEKWVRPEDMIAPKP